jgi:hypothetical protein
MFADEWEHRYIFQPETQPHTAILETPEDVVAEIIKSDLNLRLLPEVRGDEYGKHMTRVLGQGSTKLNDMDRWEDRWDKESVSRLRRKCGINRYINQSL